MISFLSRPFILIHLAGLALVPFCLLLVWIGLAVCEPMAPWDVKMILIALIGTIPMGYMQFTRPFYIYNILFFSLYPEVLDTEQRKILTLLKTKKVRVFTLIASILMLLILGQIYRLIPLAVTLPFVINQWSIIGFLVAVLAFMISNLFFQVPISLLSIIFISEQKFKEVSPYSPESIKQEFTIVGFQLKDILKLNRNRELSNLNN
jgi:hypothetical protein